MTALMVVETALLVVLAVLVTGLLRAYATILNRLHAIDSSSGAGEPLRTIPDVPAPATRVKGRQEWQAGHDISGVGLDGSIVSARTVAVEHDTVLVFLSSTCTGCITFWTELGREWPALLGLRVVVVARAPAEESPSALAALCPPGVDLVQSSTAWSDYNVPGSPYVVLVNGATGRVTGEGSGTSLAQVLDLVSQHDADRRVADDRSRTARRRGHEVEQEVEIDHALRAAGIGPGDPRLYGATEPIR